MLSRETLEAYRRMSNEERLRLTLQMIRDAGPYLCPGGISESGRTSRLFPGDWPGLHIRGCQMRAVVPVSLAAFIIEPIHCQDGKPR
jgi:hypothetical protein